jgi:hypothetical protein
MRPHLLAAALLSALTSMSSASATVLISGDNGGLMEEYIKRFHEVRQSGDNVVIAGDCMSACTMVLGMIPRERLCATPQAVLGFHASWEVTTSGKRIASASGTRDLMKTYPAAVRAWIARRGGLRPELILLQGRELAAIVPSCASGVTADARSERNRNVRQPSGGDRRRASAESR